MNEPITLLTEVKLTSEAKGYLKETANWAFFLSIIGFIGIGLLVIVALFANTIIGSLPQTQELPFNMGKMVAIIYLVIAAIYLFPVYYLMQFANKMKAALSLKEDAILTTSFQMLKSHYKFMGVFTIIILSLYGLIFVAAIIGAL